ncbi:MAG: VWA domain-containing protein [Deltaproteobacteria bacterium]|nr:VWA domain-containing protein [Deltaproteobacteria bacterium]
MTRPGLTEIVCIIDRSGSMEAIRDDAIGGFNVFLDAQQQLPGEAWLTLVLFDDRYDVVIDHVALDQVARLDRVTFVPRGSTALLDAMGRTIDQVGTRLAATAEDDRPSKVIVVVLTDGKENASRNYSQHDVFDRVAHQREQYGWDFIFLAANQDAIASAAALAIDPRRAISFVADHEGTSAGFSEVSNAVGASRMLFGGSKKRGNTVN